MDLVALVERWDPAAAGTQRWAVETVRGLVACGHRVTVVTPWCAAALPGNHAPQILCWPYTYRFRPRQFRRFTHWLTRRLPQFPHQASLSFTTLLSADVVHPWGGTLRGTLQQEDEISKAKAGVTQPLRRMRRRFSPWNRRMLAMERRVLTAPTLGRVIAVNTQVRAELMRSYHLASERITVIPPAAERSVDVDADIPGIRRRVRQGFRIVPQAVGYLFFSHDPARDGVATLLRALRVIPRQTPDLVVLLAGQIGYAEQYLAAGLGVRDRVRFVASTNHLADLYCAADVVVLPTSYAPCHRAVVESLLWGIPVITTMRDGLAELLVHQPGQQPGRVLRQPDDILALAQAMQELADPAERQRCSAATDQWAQTLSMRQHVERLQTVLAEVASTSSK